jgi:hypothetical protein
MADVTLDNGSLADVVASTKTLTSSRQVPAVELVTAVEGGARTDLAKAEDVQHVTGDFGLPSLGVRKDTAASLAGSDGDYTMPIFDSSGRLHTSVGSMPATARSTDSISVAPVLAVANDQAALANATLLYFSETVVASDTDEELIAAQGANTYLLIVALVAQCTGAATASTFESGGSTRIHKIPAGTAGGGQVLPFNQLGWFKCATNASLTVTTGTGSDTEITGVAAVCTV